MIREFGRMNDCLYVVASIMLAAGALPAALTARDLPHLADPALATGVTPFLAGLFAFARCLQQGDLVERGRRLVSTSRAAAIACALSAVTCLVLAPLFHGAKASWISEAYVFALNAVPVLLLWPLSREAETLFTGDSVRGSEVVVAKGA